MKWRVQRFIPCLRDDVAGWAIKQASGLAALAKAQYSIVVTEIIFEVREDEGDGGYVATALGHTIGTQGEDVAELRQMVREAVRCHFGDGRAGEMPSVIRLHFVRDEVLTA
jgi:predicted RNase H-like HicB family nuclease